MKFLLFLLFITICYWKTVSSLSCYQCGVSGSPACNRKAPKSPYLRLTSCPNFDDTFCVFLNLTIDNKIISVRRYCSSSGSVDCNSIVPQGDQTFYSCDSNACSSDGCNANSPNGNYAIDFNGDVVFPQSNSNNNKNGRSFYRGNGAGRQGSSSGGINTLAFVCAVLNFLGSNYNCVALTTPGKK